VKLDTTDEDTRPAVEPLSDAKEFCLVSKGAGFLSLRREPAPFFNESRDASTRGVHDGFLPCASWMKRRFLGPVQNC
jgi:hypothetical protein